MRRGVLAFLLVILVLPTPAWGQEEKKTAVDLVNELHAVIQDENADWDDMSAAHKAAKDAIAAEAEAAGEDGPKPGADAYAEIQSQVADALRRDTLPVMGWIMGFFGASLLWGGFAVCLAIARKSGKVVDPQSD